MIDLFLVVAYKAPLLSDSQLDKLSDILINVGTLFFGSMVVPFLIPVIDKPEVAVLSLGLMLSVMPWTLAILFVRKIKL